MQLLRYNDYSEIIIQRRLSAVSLEHRANPPTPSIMRARCIRISVASVKTTLASRLIRTSFWLQLLRVRTFSWSRALHSHIRCPRSNYISTPLDNSGIILKTSLSMWASVSSVSLCSPTLLSQCYSTHGSFKHIPGWSIERT